MKPLSPNTVSQYQKALKRAFGDFVGPPYRKIPQHVLEAPNTSRALLRAAMKRQCLDEGLTEEQAEKQVSIIPLKWEPQKLVDIPSEDEALAYEKACRELPKGRRALALLPLATGLRAEEALMLPRKRVEKAVSTGELTVLRKGGKEKLIPVGHAIKLFRELLDVNAVMRGGFGEGLAESTRYWKLTREIISTGDYDAAYVALYRLIGDTGRAVGIEGLRPHKLRHAFATRMNRDGAPLPVIQYALGHSQISTTMRYVHPGVDDVRGFVRKF